MNLLLIARRPDGIASSKVRKAGRSFIESGSNSTGIRSVGLTALPSAISRHGISVVPRHREKAQLSKSQLQAS